MAHRITEQILASYWRFTNSHWYAYGNRISGQAREHGLNLGLRQNMLLITDLLLYYFVPTCCICETLFRAIVTVADGCRFVIPSSDWPPFRLYFIFVTFLFSETSQHILLGNWVRFEPAGV